MKHTIKRFFNRLSEGGPTGSEGASKGRNAQGVQVATCALFLEMAHLDDSFTPEETAIILGILKEKYRLSGEHADQLLEEAQRELKESIDLWQFAKLINENYTVEEKMEVIRTLWEIVFVDGRMDRYEGYLMQKVANLLRISHEKLIQMKLEVLRGASKAPDACGDPETEGATRKEDRVMVKAVFHLDADEAGRLMMALGNISNLLKEVSADEAAVCVVANGSAVKLFRREIASDSALRIKELSARGVRFLMCNNSLNNFGLDLAGLVEGCDVIKAGVLELIERQAEGYAYIKP